MGTISEKLTYLNGTKQLLKDKINNLGGSIDEQTTFRQYVNQLDGVYDVLPKTEFQEGTSVTIENGLKGKIDFDDGKVGFGQASQESTTGKNLLNYNDLKQSAINAGFVVDSEGNIKDTSPSADGRSWNYAGRNWQITLPAGTYTLTFYFSVPTTDSYGGCVVYGSDETPYANFGASFKNTYRVSRTFTLTNETSIGILAKIWDGVCKVQLESGSTSTDWEKFTGGQASPSPNWEQPIQCVTGNQDVVVSGKNKINVPEIVMNARSYIYRANIGSGNYSISITKSRVDGVTIGNQYVYMYKEIKFYDSNDTLLSTNTGTSTPPITTSPVTKVFSFTAPQNTSYMEIEFSNNNGDNNLNTLLSNVMLVSGTYNESTMPTYEPYHTPITYPISLGSNKFYKIGDYADELLYDVENDKVYKNEKIKEVNLAQLVYEYQNESTSPTPRTVVRTYGIGTFVGDWLSNIFVQNSTSSNRIVQLSGESITYISIANDIAGISGSETESQKVQKIVSVLSEKNAVLITPKATPIQTELTDTTLKQQVKNWYYSQSFNGTTIIESNGDLPMIIKVRALKGE